MINKMVVAALLLVAAIGNAKNTEVKLTPDNTVTVRGPIDANSALKAMKEISALDNKRSVFNRPIYLVLDTPGGSIDAGEELIQYVKTLRNVHTITLFAASMGSAIVQGLPGQRLITENGVQMFHRAKVGLQGQINDGELESRLEFYKKLVSELEMRNAQRMLMSIADYRKRVKDEMWLTSIDTIMENAADDVVDIKCSKELIKKDESLEIQVFIFTITLKFSGCPLFRTPEIVLPASDGPTKQLVMNTLSKQFSPGVVK